MKRKNSLRQSTGDRVFGAVNTILITLFTIVTLYPLIYVVSASFSEPNSIASGRMILFPVDFTLRGYEFVFQYKEVWMGYANTIFYTVVGTCINIAVTIPCAYGLSRKDIPLRNFIMILFVITMYISGGMIPSYINIMELGLLDTRWALLLPCAVTAYNLIVSRTFFANTIPWELHEAAFIDGSSDFRIFIQIILPLSSPIVVVMVLYYGVAHWNEYFNAMIYLTDRTKFPLQMYLHEVLNKGKFAESALMDGANMTPTEMKAMFKDAETANLLKYCLIIVSSLPMMVVYPFLQKYFNKGIMIGAIKG